MTRRLITLIVLTGLTIGLDSAEPAPLGQRTAQSKQVGSADGQPIVSYPQAVDKSPLPPEQVKQMAKQQIMPIYGKTQWQCFNYIITKESHWNVKANNPHSTAFGIGQILDSEDNTGTDAQLQITATIGYIMHRYPSMCAAAAFHKRNDWY
jgi:hypothetical protein